MLVIDKATAVAQHQTGHNSGVVHAGVYYAPGSLKAQLCVHGAKLMYEFCEQNAIAFERCGKLIVAVREEELPRLDDLEARARANGVPGCAGSTPTRSAEIEPECRGLAALHSPATGIVDFAAVARAIERELRDKGVDFALGCEITAIRRESGSATVLAARRRRVPSRLGHRVRRALVRPAGRVGGGPGRTARCAVPRRLPPARERAAARGPRHGLPVPDPALPFLGVHVTRHIDGGVMLGPTALLVAARDGYRRPGLATGGAGRAARRRRDAALARNMGAGQGILAHRSDRAGNGE